MPTELDLSADVVTLTAALVDWPSVSHREGELADAVESALRAVRHLVVTRLGNTVVARTELGRSHRVLLGGHLDTVPPADNERALLVAAGDPVPCVGPDGVAVAPEDRLYGLGSADMKGGVAVALRCARNLASPTRDVTYVFYECEEVEGRYNGLELLAASQPELLHADLAILMEPSEAGVEAGCQGTLRAEVRSRGRRAPSARGWLGENAVHAAGEVLSRLSNYEARQPVIDGLQFREGLHAVAITGGVAGNVIPDECTITINYRYAPDRSADEAEFHVREVMAGFDVTVVDNAAGASPRLELPESADFVAMVGEEPRPKFGWTDVARFAAAGLPALNFGPGSPSVAHARHEFVPVGDLRRCDEVMHHWLASADVTDDDRH